MRKAQREITDQKDLLDVLQRCQTIRLGLNDTEYPYVVPLSFGWDLQNGQIVLYFHCAQEGLKCQLMAQNSKVCIEADIFHGYQGPTTKYESVIGFGTVVLLCEEQERIHGLQRLLQHCGMADYPLQQCSDLAHTAVYKINLHSITGKRNLLQQ